MSKAVHPLINGDGSPCKTGDFAYVTLATAKNLSGGKVISGAQFQDFSKEML